MIRPNMKFLKALKIVWVIICFMELILDTTFSSYPLILDILVTLWVFQCFLVFLQKMCLFYIHSILINCISLS